MLLLYGSLSAQTVHRIQYWFDGQYDAHQCDSTTTGSWQIEIDVAHLRDGFHTLYFHVQDTSGLWGSPRSYLFYKTAQNDSTGMANLVYTCWFDQDYSHRYEGNIGNGNLLIGASHLRDGFHTANLQLGNGTTARLQTYLFYKNPQVDSTGTANLVYTCWFDQDYSHRYQGNIGNGNLLIEASHLRDGFHTANLQLGNGTTARLQTYLFYKTPQVDSTGTANLVYTCWFDQDYSHRYQGNIGNGNLLIEASNLRDGFHTANLQLGEGSTARLQTYLIYKMTHLTDSTMELVYWYEGEDEITMRRSNPALGVHLLDVPSLECGNQVINLALKDGYGNMTSFIHRNFIMLDSTCCLPPLFVMVDSITPSTARIHWDYNREEPFTLVLDTEPFNPDSSDHQIHLTDTVFQFTGLNDYTTYYYAVKTDCDSSMERWQTGSFRTEPMWYERLYVAETGNGNGSSWQQAANNLQATLTRAEAMRSFYGRSPDIWVAQGTYRGDGNPNLYAFTLVEGCNLYGGFAGNESSLEQRDFDSHQTILEGRNIQRIMNQPTTFTNANHTIVDGFIFRHGRDNSQEVNSAAAACMRGNVTIRNCLFENNSSTSQQGAVYAKDIIIERCRFTHNTGGNGTVAMIGTTRISNSLFADNLATTGGAIYANATATDEDLNATVINSTIVGNQATWQGGGIHFAQYGVKLINCVLWNNTAAGEYNQVSSNARLSHCAVQGGFADDSTCISLEAENTGTNDSLHYASFSNPDGGDYHLTMVSACLNMGSNGLVDSLDLEGHQRVWDSVVDLGCYELEYSLSCLPPTNLIVSAVGNGTATIGWSGTAASYRVAWHTGTNSTVHYTVTSNTTLTLSNLPQTTLYWQVRSLCSDSDSSRYVGGPSATLIQFEEPTTDSGTYYIYNVPQLMWIAGVVDSTITTGSDSIYPTGNNAMEGLTVRLMASLDLGGLNWNPIGDANHPFAGTFDGSDSVIYNLTIDRPTEDCIGLFAQLSPNGQVNNLLLEGRSMVRGRNNVGCIVGKNNGGVLTNCSNKTNVSGNLYVGGITGYSVGGEVSSVSNMGNVTATMQSGGIAGCTENATVRNVYNRGNVTARQSIAGSLLGALNGGSTINAYGTGIVTAPASVGGGYGSINSATMTNCYYLSGSCSQSGGATAMAAVNMQNASFVSVLNAGQQPEPWRSDYEMPTNDNYPILNWQRSQRYTVTYSQPAHATMTVRNGNINVPSGTRVQQGTVLTVTVTPLYPYSVTSIQANDSLVFNGGNFTVREETQIVAVTGLFLPELHVSSITASAMQGGQQATISWTVRNDGNGPTQAGEVWYDRVWLATDSRVAAGDAGVTLLGEYQNVAALDSGEYYTNTINVDIPQTLNGSLYLFVITDAYDAYSIQWENGVPEIPYTPAPYISGYSHHCSGSHCRNVYGNRILELSEMDHGGEGCSWNDNFFYTLVNIQMPLIPDLKTLSVIAPATTYSGTPFNVTATISNIGERSTLVNRWSDVLYICDTTVFIENRSTRLAEVQHNGYLDVDNQYTVTLTGTLPVTMYGSYYLFVKADYYNQVYEHVLTANNVRRADNPVTVVLTPPADLTVTNITLPDTVSTAETFNFSITVLNQGAGNPNVNYWQDKAYLSTNTNTIGNNAIQLGSFGHNGGLAPSAEYNISQNLTLPSSIAEGDYWLYAVADANSNVFEYTFEDNNLQRSSHTVHVVKPDLQITAATIPDTIVSGYPTNISFTLQNSGNGRIVNRNIGYRLYISPNTYGSSSTTLATWSQSSTIQVGQSVNINCPNSIPDNLVEGTYYLFLQADVNNNIAESNENNNGFSANTVFVRHYPLPDLTVTSFTMPDSVQRGSNVRAMFDVVNIGEADIVNANCTFDVFVGNNTLCNTVRQLQPINTGRISLTRGDTLHFVRDVYVPNNISLGNVQFNVLADRYGQVREGNESNNSHSTNSHVSQAPLPDLEPIAFTIGGNLYASSEVDVTFEVINRGNANLINANYSTKIYAIMGNQRTLCPVVSQSTPTTSTATLYVNDVLQYSQTIRIPANLTTGRYNFELVIDEENHVAESNISNNSFTLNRLVREYNFDLNIISCGSQSEATTGQTLQVSWTVRNSGLCPTSQLPMMVKMNGQWQSVSGNTLPVAWLDKVFLSSDQTLSNDDVELLSVGHNTVLNPYGSYTVNQQCILPNNVSGEKYLIFVTDQTSITLDNDRTNNQMVQPISIQQGLLPDLRIAALEGADTVMVIGQAYTIRYRVLNDGNGATAAVNWADRFYLNDSYSLNGALQLASRNHNGNLASDSSYWDQVTFTVPEGWSGEMFLLGMTDAANVEYEGEDENNNLTGVALNVVQSQPCDLMVAQPTFPINVQPGDSINIGWTLLNVGSNAARGQIKEAVYLSTDTMWSSDDEMIASTQSSLNLAAGGSLQRSTQGVVQNVTEGNYYLIVRTNIQTTLIEVDYTNNATTSFTPMLVEYPALTIDVPEQINVAESQLVYYKIEVGPQLEHQTLSVQMTAESQQVINGLYVSHMEAPTPAHYEYCDVTPYVSTNEILIPALEQGTYYILAKGAAADGQPQNITLLATVINFEILHVHSETGSNAGSVTTQVLGAKFDTVMDFRLVIDSNQYLPAEKVYFDNSTETYVTFNLTDIAPGNYSIEAELPGGVMTLKESAFVVEQGMPAELGLNVLAPSSVRAGNTFSVNIEYGNSGETDLNVVGFLVVSVNGHPIGLTPDSLVNNETEVTFMVNEQNGNLDLLRPGYHDTKTLFMKATPNTAVKILVYPIRRRY